MNKTLNQIFTKSRKLTMIALLACTPLIIAIDSHAAQEKSTAVDPQCIQTAQNHLSDIENLLTKNNPLITQIQNGTAACTWNEESRSITVTTVGENNSFQNVCVTCVHKQGCIKCTMGDLKP